MAIRTKIVLVLVVFFFFFGMLYLGTYQYIILPSFAAIEQQEAVKNSKRVRRAIDRERHHLDSLLHDWSAWDETYEFIRTGSGNYAEANLPISSFTDNGLNLVYLLTSDGKVVYGKIIDLETEKPIFLDAFTIALVSQKSPFLSYDITKKDLSDAGVSGIFMTDKGPMMIASRPIITNHNQGPVVGTIMMGRFICSAVRRTLTDQTQVDFELILSHSVEAQEILDLISDGQPYLIRTDPNEDVLVIYEPVPDILGQTAFLIESRIPKKISARGQATLKSSLVSISLAGLGAILLMLLFLHRTVFAPVKKLKSHAEHMFRTGNDSTLALPTGVDEIGVLVFTLDDMFRRLEKQSAELKRVNLSLKKEMERRLQEEIEKEGIQKLVAEQKKYALVGQVAGKMAHDFNNVLGVIMGNAELLLYDCADQEIQERLELIFNQTVRGKNLTKNLVAFAKDQNPRQVFFDINEKIEQVVDLMKKDSHGALYIAVETQGDLPELFADPGMIEHTLVNLMQNAIHAVCKEVSSCIVCRSYLSDGQICFEVQDNGCGIPEESLPRIYEPSFTLKGSRDIIGVYDDDIKGTGYGMANVKKYIEQHNGSIHVVSQLNIGTTFRICLPVIEKELTQKEKSELMEAQLHVEKSILLVEDESAISEIQERILQQTPCRHSVDIAPDGVQAAQLFDTNTYDCVSLDYILSGEMTGMDVYHYIRKTDTAVPILFISGNIEFLESIEALKQKDHMVEHLSKPCRNKVYVDQINVLINRADQEARK